MVSTAAVITDVELWNDTFAREYDIDDYYQRSSLLIRWIEHRRLSWIRRMLTSGPADKILEVGCGGGHVLRMFPESDLTGVDLSGEMLRKAARNLSGYRITLRKGELHELGLHDGGFDKIICSEVLEHVVDPEAVVRHIRRLLKDSGRAVITIPNDSLIHGLKRIVRKSGLGRVPGFRQLSWGGERYHLHEWNGRAMCDLLSHHFQIERVGFAPSRVLPIHNCYLCSTK